MSKMIIKEIDLDIFEEIVIFASGDKGLKYLNDRFRDFDKPNDGADGLYATEEEKKTGRWYNIIWVQDHTKTDVIVHEVTHLVYRVCNYRYLNNTEIWAYMVTYLFKKITEAIK